MKKSILALGLMLIGSPAMAAGVHWEYSGEKGPDSWAKLTPEYGACAGSNQSPIDLTDFIEAELKPLELSYTSVAAEVLNNGHTVQINTSAGNSLMLDGIKFELKQFHFHAPSENHIKGQSFPLEGHLVHADKDGNLAVIAVMFVPGKASDILTQAWARMPHAEGEKSAIKAPLSALGLLPSDRDYYRFSGSLTTPPCSEGVRWLVMKQAITASTEQIEAFAHAIHHPNNRPVQPVKGRPILQ